MADHSPSLSISAKFGSQAVGFITVLAISGSAVVLALGKQKLLCLKNYVFESAQDSGDSELVQDVPSLTTCHSFLSAFSEAKGSNVGVSDVSILPCGRGELDVTLADFNRTFREGSAATDSSDPSLCKSRYPSLDLSSLPSASESVLRFPSRTAPPDTGKKERPIVKKVRFSADVIEPSGNNQEYRRRIESARMSTRNTDTRSQGSSNWQRKFQDAAASQSVSTCKAMSSGKVTQISGGASEISVHHQAAQDCAKRIGSSQDWRVHRLAKPKLPANQMALYNGMLQSRLRAVYCG